MNKPFALVVLAFVISGNSIVSQELGSMHFANMSIGMTSHGTVYTWGLNDHGQLGDETTIDKLLPIPVLKGAYAGTHLLGDDPQNKIIMVSQGRSHSIALSKSGKVFTWGDGSVGQIGNGGSGTETSPESVSSSFSAFINSDSDNRLIAITAGSHTSFALSTDGTAFSWGYNVFGQLGDSTTINRFRPVRILKGQYPGTEFLGDDSNNKIKSIVSSTWASMAVVQDGTAYSWGYNNDGQLGNGIGGTCLIPSQVLKGEYEGVTFLGDNSENKIISIALGSTHAIALTENGEVYTWGSNDNGQLGINLDNFNGIRTTPRRVLAGEYDGTAYIGDNPDNRIVKVSAGSAHCLALAADGTVFSWGDDQEGQLGLSTSTDRIIPAKVTDGAYGGTLYLGDNQENRIVDISCGNFHSLALASNGQVFGWGDNSNGQLGDNTTYNRQSPILVHGSEDISSLNLREPIHVPADYSSIQTALNAVGPNDTVFVEPGTYYENIFWPETNGIKLVSAGDSSNTIIDGGAISSVVYINPNTVLIDETTLISGFTIRNGGGVTSGGGIFVAGASPTLESLIIENNHSNQYGGAINMQFEANVIVRSSLIRNNSSAQEGGAFRIYRSSPQIMNSEIYNNSSQDGGGLYLVECVNPVLDDLLIFDNEATSEGGGVYFSSNSNISFINSTIFHNSAIWGGGGVYLNNQGDTPGENLSLIENHSDHMGGAIHLRFGSPLLSNLTITGNTCFDGSEGIYIQNGSLTIQGSNIFDNGTGLNNVDNTNFATALNNWWGDDTGPYHATQNALGQGDSCNVFVNVLPFLESQDTEAPPIPAQNTIVTSTGNDFISLTWAPSLLGDFAGFKLYYDTDESSYPYANSVDVGSATSHSLSGLSPGTQYFLAVTVYDTDGNESWYSTGVTGTTRVMEVQSLDIAGVEDLQHLVTHDSNITFDYFDTMGESQTDYQIQISTDSTFQSGDIWDTGVVTSNATSVQYTEGLLENGVTYYLRTKVASGAFWSDWSTLTFRMNSAPSSPELLSPENGGIVVIQPTLRFLKSHDAEEDAIAYSVYLYNTETMITPLDSLVGYPGMTDTISWTVSVALDDNAQHWWKVNSFDGYEYNTLTEVRTFLFNISNDEPDPFALISPIDESEVASLHPLFSWHPAADVDPVDTVSYVLYLDTPDPGVEVFDVGTDTSYQAVADLMDNTSYYWKVIASDLNGGSTENTAGYQSFRVNTENDLPTAFNLLAPENESMVVDLTPTLAWEPSSDPDDSIFRQKEVRPVGIGPIRTTNSIREITAYQVYLDIDSLFTETVAIEVLDPEYTPSTDLLENMVYYWKVEAVDDLGGTLFSEHYSFWTNAINEAPVEFVLLTPGHEAEVGVTPTFSWTESIDADLFEEIHYTLQYGPDVFSLTSVESDSLTVFTPSEPLEENTSYVWQVICSDTQGLQYETEFSSFYVNSENDAPSSFSLISPDSSAWLTDNDLMLVWEPSIDLEGSDISYAVSLSMDSESVQPIDTVFSNYYTLYGLEEGYYFWQIEAFDELGGSSVSPVWSFLVNAENDAPNAFNAHEPTDGQLLTTQNVTFTWEPSSSGDAGDQTSYILELGTSVADLMSIYEGPDTLFAYAELLGDNSAYYWQVTAIDLAGATTVNEGGYQSFTVNTSNDLPVAFELVSPVEEMMVTTLQPEFLWEASSDPDDQTFALRETGKGKFSEYRTYGNNSVNMITGYDFYLGTDSMLTDVVAVEVFGTSYSPETDLIENQVYYWTVSALDDSGGVTFSDTASFWTNSENSSPAEFTLLTPVDDTGSILTPTFTWTMSEDADLQDTMNYTLRYGTDVFSLMDIPNGSSTQFTLVEPLEDNTEYLWQVVAEDISGATFATEFSSFFVNSENDDPGVFSLIAPDSASWITNGDLMLVWEPSTDLEGADIEYVIHIGDDNESLNPVDTISVNYYALNALEDGYYYWQIEALDNIGGSQFSETWNFLINVHNDPPDPFALVYPESDMVLTEQQPTFTWEGSSSGDAGDHTSYRLESGNSAESMGLVYEGDSTFYTPELSLEDNSVYYWRVIAIDLAFATTVNEGGYQSFVVNTANDAPTVAELISPDSVVVLSDLPTFSWNASTDVDPHDSLSYELHWWTDVAEMDSIITTATTVSPTTPLADDNLQYFWNVITMDANGGIAHSEEKTFWVDFMPEVPGLFALLGPDSASTGNGTRPELTWAEAIDPDPFDAVHYSVAVATDSLMENVIYEQVAHVEVTIPEIDLENDTRYYWQVTAIDEDSLTTTSSTWTFDVGYVAIDQYAQVPTEFVLDQNYPNPFNPSTNIRYGLPEEANVSLVIYDVRGQVVKTLESGHQSAGWYDKVWNGETANGKTISTGIYFARLVAGEYSQVIKMLYLK